MGVCAGRVRLADAGRLCTLWQPWYLRSSERKDERFGDFERRVAECVERMEACRGMGALETAHCACAAFYRTSVHLVCHTWLTARERLGTSAASSSPTMSGRKCRPCVRVTVGSGPQSDTVSVTLCKHRAEDIRTVSEPQRRTICVNGRAGCGHVAHCRNQRTSDARCTSSARHRNVRSWLIQRFRQAAADQAGAFAVVVACPVAALHLFAAALTVAVSHQPLKASLWCPAASHPLLPGSVRGVSQLRANAHCCEPLASATLLDAQRFFVSAAAGLDWFGSMLIAGPRGGRR